MCLLLELCEAFIWLAFSEAGNSNELILCSRGNCGSSFPVSVLMRASLIIALDGCCDCNIQRRNVQSSWNVPYWLGLAWLNYQRDIQNCNLICFTESWRNDNIINIQLSGYMLYRQDRTAASFKTRGGGLCIFVNFEGSLEVLLTWGRVSHDKLKTTQST
jgi:hypothetical protein